jgi:hypothetical protein
VSDHGSLHIGSHQQSATNSRSAPEAPAAFDNKSNGFLSDAMFEEGKNAFEETEGIGDGLGPVCNASSCAGCHQNPVTGGSSQVDELRAGKWDGTQFVDQPGGSFIQDRAIDARIQEKVDDEYGILKMTARTSACSRIS